MSTPQNRGTDNNMLLSNPYSRNLTRSSLSDFFNESIGSYSVFGSENARLSSLVSNAIGHTLTTNALATNSLSLVKLAQTLLASLPHDSQEDLFALSGNGHTAQSSSLGSIITTATEDLIRARGNALIANDLLRILCINIKGFDDKIAENSFSGGIERLAESNEEFAYS